MAATSVPTSTADIPLIANGGDTTQLAQLDDLRARATLKFSIKDYNAAAELYSEATELQAEINGEMSPLNAELLYQYGKCLYNVAVKESDVLGSKVAGSKREAGASRSKGKKKAAKAAAKTNGDATAHSKVDEEVITKVVEEKDGPIDAAKDAKGQSKPYFQFTGDENFDDSGDEDDWVDEDNEGAGADEEEEEDDFANAYEALDLARVLMLKRIEAEHDKEGKGKGTEDSPTIKRLKQTLADTYDLQADISLEGERFPNAVTDLREVLALKNDLVPFEDSQIAEAHYKLSLALEFSSVTQQTDDNGAMDGGNAQVDEAMREEAAKEMELAIASCNSRIAKEEADLSAHSVAADAGDKGKVTQADIDNVKDMVKDMEQRLIELRQPPVSMNDPTSTGTLDGSNPLSGILGSLLGESAAAQKARIEEASKDANDLTGLVKRRKASNAPSPQPSADGSAKTNGKRKVDFDEQTVEVGTGKKAKLEDGED